MKKSLLIIFIALQIAVYGQTVGEPQFVSHNEVILELESSDNISGLVNKYDFLFILLLDSTKIEIIQKPEYFDIGDYRNLLKGISNSKQTIGFVTDKGDIIEIFQDNKSLKRIITCTKTLNNPHVSLTKIHSPVYVKDNTAIFETFGPSGSDIYYTRLSDGIFQINWLGGTIQ
ncbi:hypothetical protein [Saccharicrinis aurantiacus]|uniref:hypothetical protein n=1 Tax=Saccharicrinis aurantiacus TaxID=1849719 RepID=UPI00094FF1B7|nr:hypothetical protein [Saccharicrinis aurantiacus]